MWPFRRKAINPEVLPLQRPVLAPQEEPKPIPARAPKRGIIAARLQPDSEWVTQHPGRGTTSDVIRLAFDLAELGRPENQCDLFDDVLERDGHLRSLCESRLQSVAGKGWIVQAGGDDAVDIEAAQQLEQAIRRLPNVAQNWEHLLTATLYGFAACEISWDVVDGLIVPVWLANVPHRRFNFMRETDEPRLTTNDIWGDGLPLERGKWIWASMRHRRTARGGLLRSAVWWSWLKSLSVRDWQIFSSRFGLPFVTATHDPNADEDTIAKLKEAVLAFGRNGGAVFSNEGLLEVKELAQGNNSAVHPALCTMCNNEMSKVITGATLTAGEGSSTGSYALGRVHENTQFNFTLADAERLANWFASDLGQPFCQFNNLKARPPRLKVRVVREIDPLQRMQIADLFVNQLGGELDEDQIRDEFDFKRPKGEALTGPAMPATVAPGAPTVHRPR
jgi:phage gp29-like protein